MTRPLRIDLPFCLYHVMSRTNSGYIAFKDREDEHTFLDYLARYLNLFEFRLHAFCLLENHFHLLLESGERPALSKFMHRLLSAYTLYFNKRHERTGHLFQGRYKSPVVEKAEYLLTLSRYIHLNPHSDDIEETLQYSASSLPYYVSGNEPEFLYTGEILSWFEGDRKKYEHFIREGLEEGDVIEIYKQRFIGGQPFSERIMKRMELDKQAPGISSYKERVQNHLLEKDEARAREILKKVAEYYDLYPVVIKNGYHARGIVGRARIILIALLRNQLPWSEKQIGNWLRLKRGVYKHIRNLNNDEDMLKEYESVLNML
mgnify:CR=1 FL=1